MQTYVSDIIEQGKKFDEALSKINKFNADTIGIIKLESSPTNRINPLDNGVIQNDLKHVYFIEYSEGLESIDATSMILAYKSKFKLGMDSAPKFYTVVETPDGRRYAAKEDRKFIDLNDLDKNKLVRNYALVLEEITDEIKKKYKDKKYILSFNKDGNVSLYTKATNTIVPLEFTGSMTKSVYDPDGKGVSPFTYVEDKLDEILSEYTEFKKHKNNELELLHISSDEVNKFNKIISTQKAIENLNSANDEIIEQINPTFEENVKLQESNTKADDINIKYHKHLINHLTDEKFDEWSDKADKNHTHPISDYRITIESIVGNDKFKREQLPKEIFEIVSYIPNLNILATNIPNEILREKLHNGCTIFTGTGEAEKWYKIKDSTKLNTPNYMQGIIEIPTGIKDLSYNKISNKPTTVEGFGLGGELASRTKIDEVFNTRSSITNKSVSEIYNSATEVTYKNITKEQVGKYYLKDDVKGRVSKIPWNLDLNSKMFILSINMIDLCYVYAKNSITNNMQVLKFTPTLSLYNVARNIETSDKNPELFDEMIRCLNFLFFGGNNNSMYSTHLNKIKKLIEKRKMIDEIEDFTVYSPTPIDTAYLVKTVPKISLHNDIATIITLPYIQNGSDRLAIKMEFATDGLYLYYESNDSTKFASATHPVSCILRDCVEAEEKLNKLDNYKKAMKVFMG